MSLFSCQDGTMPVAKQSKKGKKDVPVSQYPNEVNQCQFINSFTSNLFIFKLKQLIQHITKAL